MAKQQKQLPIAIVIVLAILYFFAQKLGLLPSESQQPAPPPQPTAPIDLSRLPHSPSSFNKAKTLVYKEIYKGHEKTFYCNCAFNPTDRSVDLQSCGVTPRKDSKRAQRTEVEHVFPAHQFGHFRQCWREPEKVCPAEAGKKQASGRQCCEDTDKVFLTAHNDLHNLYPAVGEINGDRSNFNWGMVSGEKREYGKCAMEVDSENRRVEPPAYVQGDIARTMFYMSATYGIRLSKQDIQLFTAWSQQDAVDGWEHERNQRIEKIQGNRNPFVDGAVYDPNQIAHYADE